MNTESWLVFDIETRPLPITELKAKGLIPPPKLGNLKDPEKIKAKLEEWDLESMETAALDATRSEVCAVGYICHTGTVFNGLIGNDVSEKDLIEIVWNRVRWVLNENGRIIGYNINGFDLPYLIRRSWILGIQPPNLRWKNGWIDSVVDLMDIWCLNNREDRISLDRVAKSLGVGAKNGSGKDFAKLLESDPDKALEYLKNDVQMTLGVARKMGVIDDDNL